MIEHFRFNLSRGIQNKCILFKWTLEFLIILSCGCGMVRFSIKLKLNVTQNLGILKECNLLCMLIVDCILPLPLLCVLCVCYSLLF